MIACQRESFDVPREVAYLNVAYMGPLSHQVTRAGHTGLDRKKRPWTITSPDFFEPVEDTRDLFAQVIGADADGVAILPAVSYGVAIAANNVQLDTGGNIVLLEEQFPSNVYAWHDLAAEHELEIVTAARPANGDWTHAVIGSINERTSVVAVETCHWTDGGLVDLVQVGRRAREVGAALIVDGTQSIGAMPFDIEAIKPDFLITATYKWLLAPYGSALMWVAPAYREGVPLERSWITRRGSGDFAHLVDYTRELREGARRYDVGQTSDFGKIAALRAALRQTLDWSVEEICTYAGTLASEVTSGAEALGLRVAPDGLRAPHMLGIHLGDADPEAVAAAMSERDVFVSVRGEAVRVSPHVYNDERDVARFLEALEAAI